MKGTSQGYTEALALLLTVQQAHFSVYDGMISILCVPPDVAVRANIAEGVGVFLHFWVKISSHHCTMAILGMLQVLAITPSQRRTTKSMSPGLNGKALNSVLYFSVPAVFVLEVDSILQVGKVPMLVENLQTMQSLARNPDSRPHGRGHGASEAQVGSAELTCLPSPRGLLC